MDGRPPHFHGLDGLRGICAIVVLLFHSEGVFNRTTVFQHGYLSVDVFFILSGFVIALSYERRLARVGLAAFLKTRARRLFPIYWIGNAIVLAITWSVVVAGKYDPFAGNIGALAVTSALSMLMIPNLFDPAHVFYPENPAVWSLFGEWIANVAYGGRMFRLSNTALAAVVAAGWSAMTVVGFLVPNGWCGGGSIGDIEITILRAVPGFAMGVLLYRWYAAGVLNRLPVVSAEWMFLAWLALAAIPTFGATPVLDASIVIVAAPLLVAMLIRAERTALPYCGWLGEISYPLYTVHLGFVLLATRTPLFGTDRHPSLRGGMALIAVSIAVAWAIARLIAGRKPSQPVPAVA
jgi:peptidoglycan/LPS O-acetylase OafA/YrhL